MEDNRTPAQIAEEEAAVEAILASMTPEQRAEIEETIKRARQHALSGGKMFSLAEIRTQLGMDN